MESEEKVSVESPTSPKIEEVKDFKVTKKKSVNLTHDGISSDFEKAIEGKEIGKYRKKSLYKDTDTVDDMEKNTVELLADSSRKIIKKAEKHENEVLKELVNKVYVPSPSEEEDGDDLGKFKNSLNLF